MNPSTMTDALKLYAESPESARYDGLKTKGATPFGLKVNPGETLASVTARHPMFGMILAEALCYAERAGSMTTTERDEALAELDFLPPLTEEHLALLKAAEANVIHFRPYAARAAKLALTGGPRPVPYEVAALLLSVAQTGRTLMYSPEEWDALEAALTPAGVLA